MKKAKFIPLVLIPLLLSGCAICVDNYKLTEEPTVKEEDTSQTETTESQTVE